MLLQTIRLGRHGFYGLGSGNDFTARVAVCHYVAHMTSPLVRKIITPPSTVKSKVVEGVGGSLEVARTNSRTGTP